jgi:ATPase complex subunit ATP10
MGRGYFDDFRSFRDSGGKMFRATERLIASAAAPAFPPMAPAAAPSGAAAPFPPLAGDAATPAACLVGVAFRAGAEEMLEAWAAPFAARFAAAAPPGAAALAELSLVESAVMALWPFRGMLARAAPPAALARRALPTARLFHFGDAEPAARALGLTNRLTAYVFLLDGAGRVRWRGSGTPAGGELASLLAAGEALLREAGVPALPAAEVAEAAAPEEPEAAALSERASG